MTDAPETTPPASSLTTARNGRLGRRSDGVSASKERNNEQRQAVRMTGTY